VMIEELEGLLLYKCKPDKSPRGGTGWINRPFTLDKIKETDIPAVQTGQDLPDNKKLLVLDIDVKNGQTGLESFNDLAKCFQIPETCSVQSPSGGRHYYFAVPRDFDIPVQRHLQNLGFDGIDIQGEGRYVLAPSEKSGYTWILKRSEKGISELSPRFLKFLSLRTPEDCQKPKKAKANTSVAKEKPEPKPKPGPGEIDIDYEVERVINKWPVLSPGSRSYIMCKAIASLRGKNMPEEDALIIMKRWWEHFQEKISTPIEEAEGLITTQIKSTYKNCGDADTTDYNKVWKEWKLDEKFQNIIKGTIQNNKQYINIHTSMDINGFQGETDINYQKLSELESAILESILVLASHSQSINADKIFFTHRQIRDLVVNRCNKECTDNMFNFAVYVNKFISTENSKASKFEILKRIEKGCTGKPSQYELSPILKEVYDGCSNC
jgi:hypothetical protein